MFLSSVLFVLMYDLFSRTVFTFDILLLFKKKKTPPPENIWTRSILQSNIVKRVPYETLKFSFMVIFDRWISSSMKSEVYLSVFW